MTTGSPEPEPEPGAGPEPGSGSEPRPESAPESGPEPPGPPEQPTRPSRRRLAALVSGAVVVALAVAIVVATSVGGDGGDNGDSREDAATRRAEAAAQARAASGARLHTEVNVLVENDERFVVKGATAYLMPFYTASDGSPDGGIGPTAARNFDERATIFARMAELGVNTLRLPLAVATYETDVYELGGKDAYLGRVEAIVADANAEGLLVVIGWWDSLGARADWPDVAASVHPMMRDVHDRLAGYDRVVYEPWNEPNGVTWDEWIATMSETVTFFRRDLGYRGLLIADTIDFSWNFSTEHADTILDLDAELLGGVPNVAFANHRYANLSTCFCDTELADWDNIVGQHVDDYPIVGTEYGFWNDLGDPVPLWNEQLVAHLSARVADGFNGYTAFVWDWSDPNTLTTGDLVTLNEHGRIVETFWQTDF
jgi:Cellulase (glycosyl hydrolase family 5)